MSTTNPPLDYQAAASLIGGAVRIVMLSHEFTDGDDLGAMLALQQALNERGKRSFVVARGVVPGNLVFLPGVQHVREHLPQEAVELVIFFGCGSKGRVGLDLESLRDRPVLNIDHHSDNQLFGDVNLVDPASPATCEIIYHLIKDLGVAITKSMAINLLTGIFSDTGGFRHANTTPAILEIAAELVRRGASIQRIADYYFGRSELPKLRAWAKAIENARFDPAKEMIYSIVTEEELIEIGAQPDDLEGVVSVLNTIPEAKYSLLLKQRGDEVKGSLRSEDYKGVDVSVIARSFGGGGHRLAAGFKLKGKLERTEDGWKVS